MTDAAITFAGFGLAHRRAGREETLVSDETRRWHSGRGVLFDAMPAIAAKGKDAPVVVHRVRPT